MKHLTKIFAILAIILFVLGYYLQATNHESSGIKILTAAILFIICAFISRTMIDASKIENKVIIITFFTMFLSIYLSRKLLNFRHFTAYILRENAIAYI